MHRRTMQFRMLIAAVAVAASTVACGGASDEAPPVADDSFLQITDCRELERLASEEVDRINSSSDGDIVAAATVRFQRIVAHRDTLCG